MLDGETGYVVSDRPSVAARVAELLRDPGQGPGDRRQAWVERE